MIRQTSMMTAASGSPANQEWTYMYKRWNYFWATPKNLGGCHFLHNKQVETTICEWLEMQHPCFLASQNF